MCVAQFYVYAFYVMLFVVCIVENAFRTWIIKSLLHIFPVDVADICYWDEIKFATFCKKYEQKTDLKKIFFHSILFVNNINKWQKPANQHHTVTKTMK